MSLYVNEFCIALHSQCNWDCPYCIAKNNQIEYDEERILKEIYPIRHLLENVWLSGGEPGLLSEYFWDKLFGMSEHKLRICTNGTFIHKDFHLKYEEQIREIMVHVVRDLDCDIHPKILRAMKKENVLGTIVLHNKNSVMLNDFLRKYSTIEFNISFTDSSFKEIHTENGYEYPIEKDSALEMIKAFGVNNQKKFYTKHIDILMKAIIKNDFKHLNGWSDRNKTLTL